MKFTIEAGFWILALSICSTTAQASKSRWDQETLNQSLRQEAIAGVIPRIERLIKMGADINGKAPHGESALEYAIRFGRYGAASRLIQLGADPKSANDSGMTPLHWAAKEPNAYRIVEMLLRAGADVNNRDLYGRTALMNAAQADCIPIVAKILTWSKDIVEIDARNYALQSASSLARGDLVLHMLEVARRYQRGENDLDLELPKETIY